MLLLLDDDAFDIRSLFTAGEQGIWLDPSDFSTLFQDAAGTTPVTAVGQPVGLALDKRLGLARGPELVTNGDFAAGATGWSISQTGASVVAIAGGIASISSPAGETAAITTTPTGTTNGNKYVVQFDVVVTSGTGYVYLGDPSGAANRYSFNTSGRKTAILTKGSVTAGLGFSREAAGANFTVDNISVREIAGNHAYQTTSASRPTLQQDSNGMYYLSFDGTDDGMATPSINFTGTDKMTVWAGVRKLSDAAAGLVVELSASLTSNAGTFYLAAPQGAGAAAYAFSSRGSIAVTNITAGATAPDTSVIVGVGDISGDIELIRRNGAQAGVSTADQGTGNYGNYPLYIGRRNNTSLPFNGRIYQLIIRGAASNDGQIAATEAWCNAKTRAY